MLGEVIHGYRIDHALSGDKGGFADVYFALHVDSGAEAVVKVLKPEMSALTDVVQRFFNEARAAASIHHPGIVQIHNVGYHRARAYLLMERLRGEDLETRLGRGPVPLDRAVVFVRQTAGAIGAAHERGVIHRDLKPANLFIVPDPDVVGGERIKVLDFGIAKLGVDAGAGKTQGVFGTPAYMSPEQCASTGAVDGRADLYSLGCIFYELGCGRPPFGPGGIELIAAHLRDTPPPPRALAPWLPPAIEQVILRLLEKQPDQRFASCAALIAALDEAAHASGLPAASASQLPLSGGGASSPYLPTGGTAMRAAQPSTLVSATGAVTRPPGAPGGRGRAGLWAAIGALVVVGGAVAAVTMAGGKPAPPLPPGPGTSDAGVVALAADARAASPVDGAIALAADASTIADAGGHDTSLADSASQLVMAGRVAMLATPPRYEEALSLFRALERKYDPATLYDVGLADFQLGRFGDAAIAVRMLLDRSPASKTAPRARKLLDRITAEAVRQGIALPPRGGTAPPDTRATLDAGVEAPAGRDASAGSTTPDPTLDSPPLVSAADAAQAQQLDRSGTDALDSHHYDEAAELFQRAYNLDPRPRLMFHLCVAQLDGGHCSEARRSCGRVIATWPDDAAAGAARALSPQMKQCQ